MTIKTQETMVLEKQKAFIMLTLGSTLVKETKGNKGRKKAIKIAKRFVDLYAGDKVVFTEKGNTVTAVLTTDGGAQFTQTAKCNKTDVYNYHIGKAIALCRLLDLNAEIFMNAPQPKKNAVGQIITFQVGDEFHREVLYRVDNVKSSHENLTIIYDNTSFIMKRVEDYTGHKAHANLKSDHTLVTVNDTDAKY